MTNRQLIGRTEVESRHHRWSDTCSVHRDQALPSLDTGLVGNANFQNVEKQPQRVRIVRLKEGSVQGVRRRNISDFYRSIPPFKRAQTETVSIDVNSVLPTSDRTFEVDWVETTGDLYGAVKATDRRKGSFSIALNPPTEERLARINPLGIYVTNVSLARVL